jgi:hypothetical protein
MPYLGRLRPYWQVLDKPKRGLPWTKRSSLIAIGKMTKEIFMRHCHLAVFELTHFQQKSAFKENE